MGIFSFRSKNEKEVHEELFRPRIEESLSKLLDGRDKEQELLETLSKEVRQISGDVRKHDMALEDCLEMLEEQQEEETQSRKRIKALEEEREKLLQLVGIYQEQMWSMRKYAIGHDPAWVPQLKLAQNAVKGSEVSCGITLIEEAGVSVDYALHEVIEARDTPDESKAQTVAEVYQPGYVYQGTVKSRAKVAAYRYVR